MVVSNARRAMWLKARIIKVSLGVRVAAGYLRNNGVSLGGARAFLLR